MLISFKDLVVLKDQPVAVRLCGRHSESGANPWIGTQPTLDALADTYHALKIAELVQPGPELTVQFRPEQAEPGLVKLSTLRAIKNVPDVASAPSPSDAGPNQSTPVSGKEETPPNAPSEVLSAMRQDPLASYWAGAVARKRQAIAAIGKPPEAGAPEAEADTVPYDQFMEAAKAWRAPQPPTRSHPQEQSIANQQQEHRGMGRD